jgi:hypothetical protein
MEPQAVLGVCEERRLLLLQKQGLPRKFFELLLFCEERGKKQKDRMLILQERQNDGFERGEAVPAKQSQQADA